MVLAVLGDAVNEFLSIDIISRFAKALAEQQIRRSMEVKHVMLDLETISVAPNAGILSIGACLFDMDGSIWSTFSQACKPDLRKYAVDTSTLHFWLDQTDGVRHALTLNAVPLAAALESFRQWLPESTAFPYQLWALPASFDIPIIENAYRVESVTPDGKMPWKYDAGRCARTLFSLAGISKADRVRPVLPHDALEDAIAQARTVAVAVKKLGLFQLSLSVTL